MQLKSCKEHLKEAFEKWHLYNMDAKILSFLLPIKEQEERARTKSIHWLRTFFEDQTKKKESVLRKCVSPS